MSFALTHKRLYPILPLEKRIVSFVGAHIATKFNPKSLPASARRRQAGAIFTPLNSEGLFNRGAIQNRA